MFAGGHQRWINNRNGCDNAGRDAIPDPGVEGLTTAGAPELSGGRARYTMSKANADNMLITRAGLWIASSNRWDSTHAGRMQVIPASACCPGRVERQRQR